MSRSNVLFFLHLVFSRISTCNGVRQFTKVNLSDTTDPQAVCLDGSPSVTYMSVAQDATAPWLIWVDGPTNPVRINLSHTATPSYQWPNVVGFTYGPFASLDFADYSMSVLMYCSGDFFLANTTINKGFAIMSAWIKYLEPLMAGAPSVIAGGSTVGALGLVANIDLFSERIPKFSLLLDSPFFTPPVSLTPEVFALISSSPSPVCALNATTHRAVYGDDPSVFTPCCLDYLCSSAESIGGAVKVMLVQSLAYATSVNEALLVSSQKTFQYSNSQMYNLSLTTTKSGALVHSALRSAANARPSTTSYIAYSCIETPVLSPFGNSLCLENNFKNFHNSFASEDGSVRYGCETMTQTADVVSGDFKSTWTNSPSTWTQLKVGSRPIADLIIDWTKNSPPVAFSEVCEGMNCNPACTAVALTLQVKPFRHISMLAGLYLLSTLLLAFFALFIIYVKPKTESDLFDASQNLQRNASGLLNSSALSQAAAAGRSLEVAGLSYWNDEKKTSSLAPSLKHLSFAIPQGSLVGIIGGSGCGKSTLLEMLAGRRNHGMWTGELKMCGRNVSPEWLARNTGIVRQALSPLVDGLSLVQNLEFAAMLRVNGSSEFVRSRIDFVLDRLELGEFRNSKTCTLSGGQRKRAEVAIELLTQPDILFLDEPTSALDARTALNFMEWIAKVSKSTGSSIIISIHQPREEIWKLFGKIILLEKGFLLYADAPFSLPASSSQSVNPADLAVEIAGNRREAMTEAAAACQESAGFGNFVPLSCKKISFASFHPTNRIAHYTPSMMKQIRSFLLRLVAVHPPWKINTLRSAVGLCFLSVIVGLLLASIFWSMDTESIRTKALAFLVLVPAFLSNSFVVSYVCEDIPIFLIERSNFNVTPIAFFLHHILHLVLYIVWPFTVFPFLHFFLLWGRTLGEFKIEMFYQIVGFSQMCFVAFLSLFVFSCFLFKGNQSNAMIMNSSIESFFALFSGFLAPLPSLTVAPIRWLSYTSPAMWGYVGVAYAIANLQFPGDCGPSTSASESTCYLSQSGNSLIYSLGFNALNPSTAFGILVAWSIIFFFLSWLVLARPWHKGAVKIELAPKQSSATQFLGSIAEREQALFLITIKQPDLIRSQQTAKLEESSDDRNTEEEITSSRTYSKV